MIVILLLDIVIVIYLIIVEGIKIIVIFLEDVDSYWL